MHLYTFGNFSVLSLFNYLLIFLVAFFCNSSVTCAQKIDYAAAEILTGKVISNYPSFPEVNNAALLVRLRAGKLLDGGRPWHRYYNYPEMGINLVAGNLGESELFGTLIGASPEMILTQPLNKKLSISECAGLGISYYTKKYDEEKNPDNIAIGSHFTAFGSASLRFNYLINSSLQFSMALSVLHSSNSHIALPNVGLNLPAIGFGINYRFIENKATSIVEKPSFNRKLHFNIKAGLGINEQGSSTAPVNGPKYPIYIASFFVTKKLSYVNKIQLGLEGYFNTGVYDFIVSENVYAEHQKKRACSGFVFAGHEFLFGHFSLPAILGVYFYNPFYQSQYKLYYEDDFKAKFKNSIVMKIGIQYYLFNSHTIDKYQVYLGTYVKTNFGQADFWENAIGFQF